MEIKLINYIEKHSIFEFEFDEYQDFFITEFGHMIILTGLEKHILKKLMCFFETENADYIYTVLIKMAQENSYVENKYPVLTTKELFDLKNTFEDDKGE